MRIQIILLLFITVHCICDCDGDHYCQQNTCLSCTNYRQFWEQMIQDWGIENGITYGVPSHSNHNDAQVLDDSKHHYITPEESGLSETVFVGQKYQCVHYARYFWIMNFKASFGSINSAFQIFDLKTAQDYVTGGTRNMESILNGSTNWPRFGDLIIWKQAFPNMPYGHVAVVVGTDYNATNPHIMIAEENYDEIWDSKNYARALKVTIAKNGTLNLHNSRLASDPIEKCRDYNGSERDVVLGWVRLQ